MRINRLVLWFVCSLTVAAAACGEDDPEPGAAGFQVDAGDFDAGVADDSGGVSDGGADAQGIDAVGADVGRPDAGSSDGAGEADVADPNATAYARCYPGIVEALGVDYTEQGANVGSHCSGTNEQDITGVERVVFLGDSITAGSGASATTHYRARLGDALRGEFGDDVTIDNCSRGGAVNEDLMDSQIPNCFPDVEERTTLVIITSGGNDIVRTAINKPDFVSGRPSVDAMVSDLAAGLDFFANPTNFPAGVFVIYANVYEYTDATGNLSSCQLASLAGLSGQWEDGLDIFGYLESEYMRLALERGFDVLFLEEMFCGHGWNRDDPNGPCAARAGELWMSRDCIHPNEAGHEAIASGFLDVVLE